MVERPVSVVKELVENSIDAGATRIDVDIENGGSKLIRIRDNGCGIKQDELELALSRHATSKITCLDDLEAIISLGFRGEALASISSVSRLTLISRTEEQTTAWSVYAEGRDMSVRLKPAAHPVGSTVEVVDLFFNTPARRQFLRANKTEFGHINQLLKRISLSHFDVAITLRHNGTVIRRYCAALNNTQRERRLAAVCGTQFIKTAAQVSLEHNGLSLHGWICTPEGARAQNDIQHCFVNQRMMKDKLINHAIRQSYETILKSNQCAAYVLYINIDPHQIDVNVHPAKHEIRFHQARLVHDFIYQAVSDALQQVMASYTPLSNIVDSTKINNTCQSHEFAFIEYNSNVAVIEEVVSAPLCASNIAISSGMSSNINESSEMSDLGQADRTEWYSQPGATMSSSYKRQFNAFSVSSGGRFPMLKKQSTFSESTQHINKNFTKIPHAPMANESTAVPAKTSFKTVPVGYADNELGKALAIVNSCYLLLQRAEEIVLLDLNAATYLHAFGQMRIGINSPGLKAQPLLIPQVIPTTPQEFTLLSEYNPLLQQFGIVLRQKSESQLMVMAMCQALCTHNLQTLIPELLGFLLQQLNHQTPFFTYNLATWLAEKVTQSSDDYGLPQAVTLITELEHYWQGELAEHYPKLLRPVDIATAIAAFQHE
ncbi:DNA mismatch repair endonuclease MutL [Candidatus Enterovibrio altilux]